VRRGFLDIYPWNLSVTRNKLRIARDIDMMDESRKKARMYLQ
jgi:hypothetical protein